MFKFLFNSYVALFGSLFFSSALIAVPLNDSFEMKKLSGKTVGYYSGSFDPIHLGHQYVIENVLGKGYVDYVLIYPAPGGDHFKSRSELALRQKMIASLYQDNPQVLFTHWSPKQLQDNFSQVEAEVVGIIGSDIVTEKLMGPDAATNEKYSKVFMRGIPLKENHFYDTVGAVKALKADSFIVALRGNVDLSYLGGKIYDRPIRGFIFSEDMSSTKVREAVRCGGDVKQMVSLPVQQIIEQEGVYCNFDAE
ncbi:MAG: nicotinate-nucleotide adenylyltransferase [Chlamydiae bacterium]|nr:nicotinate-nucleotide adenylyltransferase [Chlamydiota bacterium]